MIFEISEETIMEETKEEHRLKSFLLKHWHKSLIVAVSLLLIVLSFSGGLDKKGRAIVDDSFDQALVVFGTAKALNGVISLAQGTEVGPPGVTIAIGEVLDPVNDLVERFSWIMLASITSLGIQTIFMNIVTDDLFNYLLLTLIVSLDLWLIFRSGRDAKAKGLFYRLAMIMLFLRFSVPLMSIANDLTYTHFVQNQYNIVELDKEITTISQDIEQFKKSKRSIFDTKYYTEQMEHYQTEADQAGDHIIRLIIAFVFQTIVFPLLFLFFLYKSVLRVSSFGRNSF